MSGKGMLMQPDPVIKCYRDIRSQIGEDAWCVYLSPKGRHFTQTKAKKLLKELKPDSIEDIIAYEGPVFGASAIECGNYANLDLTLAKAISIPLFIAL